jgi:hypothetical protein
VIREAIALVVALILATACTDASPGPSDPQASDPTPATTTSAAPVTFPRSGCPLDDREACDIIAEAARALVDADTRALLRLSRPDRFVCEGLPTDLFPACAQGGVLRGHPIASAAPIFEVLRPAMYRSQVEAILSNVDPSYTDAHGSGAITPLGVGTCGPEEIERRSYHLGMTMAVSEGGAPAERSLGSFEFIHRDGRWWIGVWYLDTLEKWEQVSSDPFSTIACGNMVAWGSG